jgi:hypothetical protein
VRLCSCCCCPWGVNPELVFMDVAAVLICRASGDWRVLLTCTPFRSLGTLDCLPINYTLLLLHRSTFGAVLWRWLSVLLKMSVKMLRLSFAVGPVCTGPVLFCESLHLSCRYALCVGRLACVVAVTVQCLRCSTALVSQPVHALSFSAANRCVQRWSTTLPSALWLAHSG